MVKSRPPYPAEFRQQMVELVQAGLTPAELARESGCTAQSIVNWVGQAAADAGRTLPGKAVLSTAERTELTRLRRESRQLRMERGQLHFASLECELLERRCFTSKLEERLAMFICIEGWYNLRRRHSAIGYQSPVNFERARIDVIMPKHLLEHGYPPATPALAAPRRRWVTLHPGLRGHLRDQPQICPRKRVESTC